MVSWALISQLQPNKSIALTADLFLTLRLTNFGLGNREEEGKATGFPTGKTRMLKTGNVIRNAVKKSCYLNVAQACSFFVFSYATRLHGVLHGVFVCPFIYFFFLQNVKDVKIVCGFLCRFVATFGCRIFEPFGVTRGTQLERNTWSVG